MYLDDNFLNRLFAYSEREVYARITALNFQEKNLESITGQITGGSVNIDGNSAVRRTCSVTMVAQDVNINEFYWGLRNKFRLEIGLKNMIDANYPDIIWFKQGTFIITSFNTTRNVNSYNISISGKDKMCLLNGDIAGAIPHLTDFGVEEYDDGETVTYTNIKIHTILMEMLQNFGNELVQNIVINDLEEHGLDLLEYRGDIPLYLIRDIDADLIRNITPKDIDCIIIEGNTPTKISDTKRIKYDTLSNLSDQTTSGTQIKFSENDTNKYTIIKLEYGSLAGYRLSDLIYAGDLIANAGETITSVLDKIVKMLGDFEYFYDLDGKFIFQKKRNYVNTAWNTLVKNEDTVYADAAVNQSSTVFNLLDNILITSFQNNPSLLNLRNDYTVWGKKKTISGSELDIHMRYAIDRKPKTYTTIDWKNEDGSIKKHSQVYSVNDGWDWRELIYQMARDYRQNYHNENFLINVADKNQETCPYGKTGYEQYYIDLEGFWRLLYNPEPYIKTTKATKDNYQEYFIKDNGNYITPPANSYNEDETYYEIDLNYNHDTTKHNYWHKDVNENPESLIFWFDFLDAEGSDLSQYSVPMIGSRTKVVNDNEVKNIYYRDIPKIIYTNQQNVIQSGYTIVQLQPTMENLFTISSKGKSCKEAIDSLLYTHSYCAESSNITTIPIYSLQPNTRILIKDDQSKINGEYIVSKITVPLTYNGTMSITATKAVSTLI